jgi:hypothetical protein
MPCKRHRKSRKPFKPEPNPSELNMRKWTCQLAPDARSPDVGSSPHQARPSGKPALPRGQSAACSTSPVLTRLLSMQRRIAAGAHRCGCNGRSSHLARSHFYARAVHSSPGPRSPSRIAPGLTAESPAASRSARWAWLGITTQTRNRQRSPSICSHACCTSMAISGRCSRQAPNRIATGLAA